MSGYDRTFRGIVLGLPKSDVKWVLDARLVQAHLRTFSPISTWMLGLSKDQFLDRADLSGRSISRATPLLLAIWALEAVAFFVTLDSFFSPVLSSYRYGLVIVTVGLGIAALSVTVWIGSRRRSGYTPSADRSSDDRIGWIPDIPLDIAVAAPEIMVVVLAIAFLAVLATFILFVLWLPVLFLVVSLVTLGAWWRIHRVAFVTVGSHRGPELRVVGDDLLSRGAILSKTWDVHLDEGRQRIAMARRRYYRRGRGLFVLFGFASLSLAAFFVAERFLPSEKWASVIAAAAGLVAVLFLAFLATICQLRFTESPEASL